MRDGIMCYKILIAKQLEMASQPFERGLKNDMLWLFLLTDRWKRERKMKLLSNCCLYLRHSFESHRGIKASKIEAYADFFMFRWSLTRKTGLKKTIEAMFNMVCGTRKDPNFTA